MSDHRKKILEEERRKALDQMEKQTVWHDGERNIQYNTGDALRFFEEAENAFRLGMNVAAINKLNDCIGALHKSITDAPVYLCSRMLEYYLAYGKSGGARLWYEQMIKAEPALSDPGLEQKIHSLEK